MDLIISTLSRALVAGTPLLFGTIGEIIAERSGVFNLGIEGMMATGAVVAFGVTLSTGSVWFGFLMAIIAAALLSSIHAFICITLKGKQTLSGLALTMIGLGISGVIGRSFIGIPLPDRFSSIKIPYLSLLPIIGPVLFSRDILFYIALFLAIFSYILLYKTRVGINLRSAGESPKAADSLGVNVNLYRYIAVIIGGAMAGMGGAYLSTAYIPQWIEGMVGGRGWIVVALTIFAYWNPLKAIWTSYLFGGIYILQYLLQPLGIPPSLLMMLPYLSTLIILIFTSRSNLLKRIGSPEALGEPFLKEDK
ncbi:MAG TPA: ABC transporter permease [Exilispira sp.]|nr:ABC transporter permease [Exilispira sp.]